MGKEDDRFAAAGNHAKPADFRSKVLAVGGVSGTYEELTGHKQELKVSMSVWVSPKLVLVASSCESAVLMPVPPLPFTF